MCFSLQVMWRNERRLIARLNRDRQMSLTHGGITASDQVMTQLKMI